MKPLIIRNNLIIAGHQRSKAAKAEGFTHCPVFILPDNISKYDEIRFNQLHNGTDLDSGDENCVISGLQNLSGFHYVSHNQIDANLRASFAVVRAEISALLVKFGNWGACVVTESGEVIHAAQYALACKILKMDLLVYVVKDADKEKYRKFLSNSYGEYSYEHLEKNTFIQTLAQRHRLSGDSLQKSSLYSDRVIPYLKSVPDLDSKYIMDFASGRGTYAKQIRDLGYNVHDVELFRRVTGKNIFDLPAINEMIDILCEFISNGNRYDVVICDSVFNSVDCLEAEKSVTIMLSALGHIGTKYFFSGRPEKYINSYLTATKISSTVRRIEFPDKDGFTAFYRNGEWFYQKYHSESQIDELSRIMGVKEDHRFSNSRYWHVEATKTSLVNEEDLIKAIEYEFNLPLSNKGDKIDRANDVKKAFGL